MGLQGSRAGYVIGLAGCALLLAALGGCGDSGSGADEDEGESNCSIRSTHHYGGEAPSCNVGLDCGGVEYRMSCADAGTCTCTEDGAEKKSVPYEDGFCAPTFEEGADNAGVYVDAAGAACGWPS